MDIEIKQDEEDNSRLSWSKGGLIPRNGELGIN